MLSAIIGNQRNTSSAAEGRVVDEFLIPSASGSGGLLFYDRSPFDPTQAIGRFRVRVTDHNLSADAQVWAGYSAGHPLRLFEDMARQWSGWPAELVWESLEGELAVKCSHYRRGHISIRVEVRSGCMPDDWQVSATVMAEAGQLEAIAQQAASFFGREW